MLRIGDFSKLSRISIRMLRHYDEIGLLVPENIDVLTNYRYYSECQLPIADRITALKDMGFSLASILEILKNYEDSKALAR
ncbi:MerR family transcriptional regulator, partial [Lachnoclostridium sp.]